MNHAGDLRRKVKLLERRRALPLLPSGARPEQAVIPPGALIGGATARKRVIGGVALIVAAALTVAGAVLIGDFATTTYAGYEVGLQRGAIIVVVLLAVIGPAAGVLVLRAARRDPSGQ